MCTVSVQTLANLWYV